MSHKDIEPAIFIIDRDVTIGDSTKAVLADVGLEVEVFSSVDHLLKSWNKPRPGCLLLDVQIDSTDGQALLESLRRQHRHLPIIVTSANASVSIGVQAMKLGAINFLEKPYCVTTLRTAVDEAVQCAQGNWADRQRRTTFDQKIAQLSPRELEVYQLLIRGFENKQIAQQLGISPSTVEKHRLAVVKKMQTDNITQLLAQKYEATGTLHDSPDDVP